MGRQHQGPQKAQGGGTLPKVREGGTRAEAHRLIGATVSVSRQARAGARGQREDLHGPVESQSPQQQTSVLRRPLGKTKPDLTAGPNQRNRQETRAVLQ